MIDSGIVGAVITFAADVVETTGAANGTDRLFQGLLAVVVFSVVGIVVLGLSMWIIERITPFSLRKEIEEDQNTALAVVVGAMMLGMSIIIAAAILG